MTRTWFLTWTTYGTWLPGDRRGFVTHVRDPSGEQVIHNQYGTPNDADMPRLEAYARSIMRQDPVRLTHEQARHVAEQLRETASYRGWSLLALAVMANHVHLVVEVPEEAPSDKLLGDFKAYATRRLNREFGGGKKRLWWTERGSTRLLTDAEAVTDTVQYVEDQPYPLVVWSAKAGAGPAA
jgi:REP element-mobilizing transposase RayT